MATDELRLEIIGDVDYFQYLSIGLYVIHPALCFLKIFEISRKFRKNRQFDISESHRAFNRWKLMDLDWKSVGMSITCNIYRLDSMLFIRHCVFLKYLTFRVKQEASSMRYFRVTYSIQSLETDGSRLEISGDVDYFQYLSTG